jgi:hypothetical protein
MTSFDDDGLDEMLEAYDADIQRVDLVKTSANGSPFILMKAGEGGLLPPEQIEALIKEAETSSAPTPMMKSATLGRGAGRQFSYTPPDPFHAFLTAAKRAREGR